MFCGACFKTIGEKDIADGKGSRSLEPIFWCLYGHNLRKTNIKQTTVLLGVSLH